MSKLTTQPSIVFPPKLVESQFEMFLDSAIGSDLSMNASLLITPHPWGLTGTIGVNPGPGWWVLARSIEGSVIAQSELPADGEPFVLFVAPSRLAGGWVELTRNQLHLIGQHGQEPTGGHLRWRRQLRFSLAVLRYVLAADPADGSNDESNDRRNIDTHLARIRSCAHLARIDPEIANDLATVLSGALQGRAQRRCRLSPGVADLLVPIGWRGDGDPLGRHIVVR